jgi:hypothetical protein
MLLTHFIGKSLSWIYLLLPLIFYLASLTILIIGTFDEASLLFLRRDFLTT